MQESTRLPDQGKTISYNNLSFSVNYLPTIGNTKTKNFVVWVFLLTMYWAVTRYSVIIIPSTGCEKDPILPTARRFYFLGCFPSFGVDRSDDVINSNL